MQPAVGCYNSWANLRNSSCSPLGENLCEIGLLHNVKWLMNKSDLNMRHYHSRTQFTVSNNEQASPKGPDLCFTMPLIIPQQHAVNYYFIFQTEDLYAMAAKAMTKGPLLQTKLNITSIKIRTCISNDIFTQQWNAIPHPCPNPNGSLTQLLLKLVHGWVITPHIEQCIGLLIHNPIRVNLCELTKCFKCLILFLKNIVREIFINFAGVWRWFKMRCDPNSTGDWRKLQNTHTIYTLFYYDRIHVIKRFRYYSLAQKVD